MPPKVSFFSIFRPLTKSNVQTLIKLTALFIALLVIYETEASIKEKSIKLSSRNSNKGS